MSVAVKASLTADQLAHAFTIYPSVSGSLAEADPAGHLAGYHTDLPRLLAGGVGVQFWSVFVPAWSRTPLRDVLAQVALVEEMSRRAPELTALAAGAEPWTDTGKDSA